MSNVRYGCPTNPETGCGARMFGAPGGTRLKCPVHDVVLIQQEPWAGATFEYVEEDGRSRTGTATHLRTDPRPTHFKNIKEAPDVKVKVVEDKTVIMARLRERYQQLYHKKADKRIGETRLRNLVKVKEEELEAQSRAKTAAMRAGETSED